MIRTGKGCSFLFVGLFFLTIIITGCEGGGGGGNVETINVISVPPAPDTTVNQASLSGVDVNSNGIRDDVERLIATDFGTNSDNYTAAANFAQTLQAAITSPKQETITQHISTINCETDSQKLANLKKIAMRH